MRYITRQKDIQTRNRTWIVERDKAASVIRNMKLLDDMVLSYSAEVRIADTRRSFLWVAKDQYFSPEENPDYNSIPKIAEGFADLFYQQLDEIHNDITTTHYFDGEYSIRGRIEFLLVFFDKLVLFDKESRINEDLRSRFREYADCLLKLARMSAELTQLLRRIEVEIRRFRDDVLEYTVLD